MNEFEIIFLTMAMTALFLTLLTSVAGMTLACANTLAHDLFAHRGRTTTPRQEMVFARASAAVLGVLTIMLATLVQHQNQYPLALLAVTISASALAPAMIYSLLWRRFTRTGLVGTLIGGSVAAVVLSVGTPQFSGTPFAVLPDVDLSWLPLASPGIVSAPRFVLGMVGTMLSWRRETEDDRKQYASVAASILAGVARAER
ncbi:hypothetical protein ACH4VM_33440 [Streptomyces sp. NPDC020792]|uniref:sodium:solute symporter family transporter n=1 Tax=Streptomyces sp. NPDC020792 TaxID=3365089 RepID=UPI0037930F39